MTEISVAMTTYNGEKYLRLQLDSLYSQTCVPDEIVVCDDGSTDQTISILEEYHKKYGLKYFVSDLKLGVNRNFEKAIRLCTGKYVAISDQDDVWDEKKIEILLKKMKEIEADLPAVVSSQVRNVDAEGRLLFKSREKRDNFGAAATLLRQDNIQGCTLMLNRNMINILNSFPKEFRVLSYDGYISFVSACCGIKYNLGMPLMNYRHHQSNVCGRMTRNSMYQKIITKLRYMKYSRVVPYKRFDSLKIVQDEYGSIMLNDAKKIINLLFVYRNSNLLLRIKVLCSMPGYSFSEKVKHVFWEALMCVIPLAKPVD